jgi:hypothetical protein
METILLSLDGDQWCALYGPDLQEGIAGFGHSIPGALKDLAKELEEAGVLTL